MIDNGVSNFKAKGHIVINETVEPNYRISNELCGSNPNIKIHEAQGEMVHASIYRNSLELISETLKKEGF